MQTLPENEYLHNPHGRVGKVVAMKTERIFLFIVLLVLPKVHTNQEISLVKHWKEILLKEGDKDTICSLSLEGCTKVTPYNATKKAEKSVVVVDHSENENIVPEKSIENFDEWTKKRRDAVANQNGQQKTLEPVVGSVVRHDEVQIPPIPRPARNFASRECGAKVIAANPEAENAKAVVNEKDVDDYMRNPCHAAKEKFFVVELCEAIQVKKIAIGNFELFASRPKTIHVFISERYPPLGNWISLGSFQLQDHHKHLQTFEVPNTNVYAKFVRINIEDHYGKEHYCIVSVVNVMGSTLADEYEKEEAAAHLLNVIEEKKEEVTTPPPSEIKVQTQLPVPPKAPNRTVFWREKGFNYRQMNWICNQCSVHKISYLFCRILPSETSKSRRVPSQNSSIIKPPVSEKQTLKTEFRMWAERSRHLNFDQARRRNIASIQRLMPKKESKPEMVKTEKQAAVTEVPKPKTEPILPAGGSTSQREMVLMKLSKRIAAVEMNLTLSTEYLSELSKQYVSQMSGYQQELKETRKASRHSVSLVETVMRSKMNSVRRELRDLRQSVYVLQQIESNRFKQAQNEMSRNMFMSSCHISSNVPPNPTLARLPFVIPSINGKFENLTNFEERIKKIYETAKSVMFGSLSWNTDHLIVALITFNMIAVSFLFAGVFYIHRRNKEHCEHTQSVMKNELRTRIAKVSFDNRKLIAKGLRRAELAVTAAVSSALKIEKSSNNRKAMGELETALSSLFAAQQNRIEEQFELNQRLLKDALADGRTLRTEDTLSVEDSESCSETEQVKEETPTF